MPSGYLHRRFGTQYAPWSVQVSGGVPPAAPPVAGEEELFGARTLQPLAIQLVRRPSGLFHLSPQIAEELPPFGGQTGILQRPAARRQEAYRLLTDIPPPNLPPEEPPPATMATLQIVRARLAGRDAYRVLVATVPPPDVAGITISYMTFEITVIPGQPDSRRGTMRPI